MNALDQIYGLASTVARQAFQIEQLEQRLAEVTKERDELKTKPASNGGTDEAARQKIAEGLTAKGR